MLWGLFSWLIFGLVAGALGKLLMPGDDPGGCFVTSLLGIAGAFVGGFIGTRLEWGSMEEFNIRSLFLAVLGTVLLLTAYRFLMKKK